MQRSISILISIAMAGCFVESTPPQAPRPEDAGDSTFRRPLVTDHLPFQAARQTVRTWHAQHGWCLRRVWPSTDEFVVCDQVHPYLDLRTPPMYSMAKYDPASLSIAYATFTPVPCRMYGRCDKIYGRTVYQAEHDFVDHQHGLYDQLAERGQASSSDDQPIGLPSMQRRMHDALAVELRQRYGAPSWQDPHRYGEIWDMPGNTVGLFVGGRGAWVIETHEMTRLPEGPPGAISMK